MHTEKNGDPKIVPTCDLPLTTKNSVDMIITDLAVFKFIEGKLTLIELLNGATLEEVREKTSAKFEEKLEVSV